MLAGERKMNSSFVETINAMLYCCIAKYSGFFSSYVLVRIHQDCLNQMNRNVQEMAQRYRGITCSSVTQGIETTTTTTFLLNDIIISLGAGG